MKTLKNLFSLLLLMMLSTTSALAGLVWTNGALSNPDELSRRPVSVAYSANGTIYVTGSERNTTGSSLIVTRKYSSAGTILNTATNSYVVVAGTVVNDYPVSVALDANGNVYVFGRQYASSARSYDMVLIKYNSSLVQQWKKLIYNSSSSVLNFNEKASKMLIDKNNNIFISGTWSNPTSFSTEEIVVSKYNSAGTSIFSTAIPQISSKTYYDSGDMCLDSSNNITIASKAENSNSDDYLMYARITNNGILDWQAFAAAPAGYKFSAKPQVECTPGGVFYIATGLYRVVQPYSHYSKMMIKKFQQNGLALSTIYTPELNLWINEAILKMDADENIYAGADFIAPTGGPYNSHRIYKYNSNGTASWTYTSAETAYALSFETFASSSLFVLFQQSSPIKTKLRKLTASSGSILWTESITTAIPPGYIAAEISPVAIAINSSTSEVAFCGQLFGDDGVPTNNSEYRWQVRKYGATSPRFADENISENKEITLFPVPANDYLTISVNNSDYNENNSLIIHDINGREILRKEIIEMHSDNITISTSELSAGVYMMTLINSSEKITKKFVIER